MTSRLLVLFLLVLCGCKGSSPNPFLNQSKTVIPPPSATLVFTSNSYQTTPGGPREVFAVADSGSGMTQLTFCNSDTQSCDTRQVAPAPDHTRIAVVRALRTVSPAYTLSSAGALSPADPPALVFMDLGRGAQGQLVPSNQTLNPTVTSTYTPGPVSSVDWFRAGDVLVYSSIAFGGLEDLFRIDYNGQNNQNLTSTSTVRERSPRIDPSGSVAVFERIDSSGKGQIFIYSSQIAESQVTEGGPGSDILPGTPYMVGSDADPTYSPDGTHLAFRRLTALGNNGRGFWDIMTVNVDRSGLTTLATGPAYRGAPDWGPRGIVFPQIDLAAGRASLILVQPDGSGLHAFVTVGSSFELSSPRWLP